MNNVQQSNFNKKKTLCNHFKVLGCHQKATRQRVALKERKAEEEEEKVGGDGGGGEGANAAFTLLSPPCLLSR